MPKSEKGDNTVNYLQNFAKSESVIYTLYTICKPNIKILAHAVLQIVCSRPSVESPWTQWTPWTFTMDSVDIYHGFSEQSGQCRWTLWTKSSESIDKVQWDQPDWTMSMDSVGIVHGLKGHCQHIVHGHPGQVQGVQVDWTMSTDKIHWVHGLTGHCPWTHWTLSSLIWLKKLKLK